MPFSMKTAVLVIAGAATISPGVLAPVFAQSGETGRTRAERPVDAMLGASESKERDRSPPMRMGHPDGPIENQINKGRPGANGR